VVQPRYPRDEFVEQWVVWARDGQPRQWAALLRAPERLDRLRAVTVPTLVVHGRLDAELRRSAAADMAAAMTRTALRADG
jgi:pimeloyl-ACP methyl ester carboxylesterase